jgi:hypothetical protein
MASGTSGLETCKRGNQAPKYMLRELPQSHGGEGRHACVVCAYEAGIKEELARAEPSSRTQKCTRAMTPGTTVFLHTNYQPTGTSRRFGGQWVPSGRGRVPG